MRSYAKLVRHFLPIFMIAAMGVAEAQPARPEASALPVESVTVTVVKPSDEVIRDFIEKRATRARVVDRMGRWTSPVCPQTFGLNDTYARYVSQRIRDVAKAVGAPVNSDLTCRPKIEVVFTTTPQALLDNLRKADPLYLGYYTNAAQADRLARVTHPIQAWYLTESIDDRGNRLVDSGKQGGGTTLDVNVSSMSSGEGQSMPGAGRLEFPSAVAVRATGWRIRDGLSSGFFNVLIVAEPAKLLEHEVGTLADYIAMLALSQTSSLDSCQALPSISNLLAKDCATVPARITDGDLAYLRALYKGSPGTPMIGQINQMRYEMKKTLVTDKGGPD